MCASTQCSWGLQAVSRDGTWADLTCSQVFNSCQLSETGYLPGAVLGTLKESLLCDVIRLSLRTKRLRSKERTLVQSPAIKSLSLRLNLRRADARRRLREESCTVGEGSPPAVDPVTNQLCRRILRTAARNLVLFLFLKRRFFFPFQAEWMLNQCNCSLCKDPRT